MNGIDTTNFVFRTKYEKDGSDFEKKIIDVDRKVPDVSGLVKKINLNAKITEIKGKTPSITGLATNSPLTAIVSSLATKTEFDAKLKSISDRVTSNKSKHLLVENELKKLKTFDPSFQTMYKCF